MKDIPHPHLVLKFQPKICKSPMTRTCPKFICFQKMHVGPLGVKEINGGHSSIIEDPWYTCGALL